MFEQLRSYLSSTIGIHQGLPLTLTLLAFIACVCVASYYICKFLLAGVERVVHRTSTDWDDDLITPRFLRAVSQLAPAFVVSWLLPGFFQASDSDARWLSTITSLYIIVALVRAIIILLSNLKNAFQRRENLRIYATSSIFQTIYLIIIAIGALFGLSLIIGRSPMVIITALGASAAVLMLVFRDTILGLVASVQLSANKMLKHGDWIVAEKHGANGEVIDVSLTTIKVRNWDNSVTTIPPYSLVSESFKNFEPMRISGGRRVDRAIYIDVNTVRFCSREELEKLEAEGWLDGLDIDKAAKMVNMHLLRIYLLNYLRGREDIRKDMTLMVRQLDPTQSGLPLQLYFFTAVTEWTKFETIQSDIFDHIYAVIRLFGLRIFQTPAGTDISSK